MTPTKEQIDELEAAAKSLLKALDGFTQACNGLIDQINTWLQEHKA
jgi:hypothetical protein